MQILILNGFREEASSIAKSLSLKAYKYNLLHIVIECYSNLVYVSNRTNNISNSKKYTNKFELAHKESLVLKKAEFLKDEITNLFKNQFNLDKKSEKKILIKIDKLYEYYKETGNPEVNFYYKSILILYYFNSLEFNKCIEICNETLKYFSKHKFLQSPTKIIEIETYKVIAYSYLNKFTKAEKSIKLCISLIQNNSRNEIYFLHIYIIVCFYQKKFNEILSIYNKIINNPFYNLEKSVIKEFINLVEGYLLFICKQKGIDYKSDSVYNNIKNFDIDTFYKKAVLSRSDKKIKHVAILILQILFYIQDNRFDDLTKRMENLIKYRSKYLNIKEHPRFYLFLKLISLIERQYNPNDMASIRKIKKKSNELLSQMKTHRIQFNEKLEPYEIIPFEVLWEEIINIIDGHTKANKNYKVLKTI